MYNCISDNIIYVYTNTMIGIIYILIKYLDLKKLIIIFDLHVELGTYVVIFLGESVNV